MYGGQMDCHVQELEAIVEGTRRQKGNLPFVVLSFAALAMIYRLMLGHILILLTINTIVMGS